MCLMVLAQQRPQHTQYVQNNYLLNPAVAGIESYTDLRSGFRSQWVGMEGAPITFYTSIQTSIGKNDRNVVPQAYSGPRTNANRNNRFYVKPHHGIGAVAQVDKLGLLTTSSLNISYAYHIPLTREINLSSGITAGAIQYRLNRDRAQVQTPDAPFLTGDFGNMNKLDLGVGLWLYSRNFYVGLSGTQLVPSKSDVNINDGPRASLQPHYYATAGYRLPVSPMITFTPSVMVKMAEGGLTTVDVNVKALYGEVFWGGASYRHKDAVAAMAGVFLSHRVDVSYSYDFTSSELNRVSANSHEVVVGIKLNNRQKVVCPHWVW